MAPSDLARHYAAADGVFLPSMAEIFSATWLEAFAAGKPLLCADIEAAREICGNGAHYFDGYRVGAAQEALQAVAGSETLRQKLVAAGKEQLLNFTKGPSRADQLFELLLQNGSKHKTPFMKGLWALRRFRKAVQDYGWPRARAKAMGRLGIGAQKRSPVAGSVKNLSVMGCGQAAFATLCYFIQKEKGAVFLDCYDPNARAAQKLKAQYGFEKVVDKAAEIFQNKAVKQVVIASNHASHTAYAVEALKRGLHVFCEKPLCTTPEQLQDLDAALKTSAGTLWAGFNRPYAPATCFIAAKIKGCRQPLTLHCYVHGHLLPADHWYRKEEEGTRISGNMGHWIDLAIHLMAMRGFIPETFTLTLAAASPVLPKDDNVVLLLTTDFGDLVSISLNARHEPFGGIRETIEVQCSDFAAQIADYKALYWWQKDKEGREIYKYKDPGHEALIRTFLDPEAIPRPWNEVRLSTALTLHASDLARNTTTSSCTVNAATLALTP